jgi:hypothetical protein
MLISSQRICFTPANLFFFIQIRNILVFPTYKKIKQSEAIMRKIILCTVYLAFLSGCSTNRLKINVSDIRDEVKIVRYEEELFALGTNPGIEQIRALQDRYPDFTDLFSCRIIRIGNMTGPNGIKLIADFLNDTTIRNAKNISDGVFRDFGRIRKELINAFRHYRYYFPGKPLPVIYTCISGFNEQVFITDSLIGISLDKYLGPECRYYSMLDIPRYRQRRMFPEMIPADVMRLWGSGEFVMDRNATTLLDHMIYEGKLLYFLEAMMPACADTLLTGFTRKQSLWCSRNEAQMWNYLVENKLLFSTKQMDIVRYINDGPFTNGFPDESPARTGAWIGWQIVRSYMERNPETGLPELMAAQDSRHILNASVYTP